MPRMSENTATSLSVAANATSTNRLAGLTYEFLPSQAHIILAAAASAVGLNCTLLVMNGITVLDDMMISRANRYPIVPDDIAYEDDVGPGRMILRFRNSTGAAITVDWFMDVTF